MGTRIEEISYLEYRGIKLSNSVYEAVVLPERGANLIGLRHKLTHVTILREPDSMNDLAEKKYEYGVPVLFFPNRIEDGRFVFEGREYRFPVNEPKTRCHLHGFLHDKEWRVEESKVLGTGNPYLKLSYNWGTDEEQLRLFPHPVLFTLEFELSPTGMRQTVIIENQGDKRMPLGFGYHTSFSVPRGGDYEINLSLGQKWEMTERHFPSGILSDPNGEGEICLDDNTGRIFGHYTLKEKPFYGEPLYGAVIRNLKKNYRIAYRFDKPFTHIVVWNKTGEDGFICIEPQTCAINAFNIDKSDIMTGRLASDGGNIFMATTSLSLMEHRI